MNPKISSMPGQWRAMRVLLLHPEDRYPPAGSSGQWDLIVDFGHAAEGTHQEWSRQAGCRVLNIFDFSEDIQDLYRTRELLQIGMGQLVDRFGIDWWDVLSIMITPSLLHLQMVLRLAPQIDPRSDLYMSHPFPGAQALAKVLGRPLNNLESRSRATLRRMQRYFHVLSGFHPPVIKQIIQDKFDSKHVVRSRLARRRPGSGRPMVLLPSAYANVSRTEVSYALDAPDDQFLLVTTRRIAELDSLPANVQAASLDSYFGARNEREIASVLGGWPGLRLQLVSRCPDFAAADAAGVLDQVPALLPWGISVRDAWMRLFDTENFIACLTADDSNPYTRLPLIIAIKRGIPALACHHGALDYAMAMKTNYADSYLAKTEMETDYLRNICRFPPEAIVDLAPSRLPLVQHPNVSLSNQPWMVFFTENSISPWRGDEVYRELMPMLASLARTCDLQLVFKLHPFESKKSYDHWVKRYLPGESGRGVVVMTGVPSAELWKNARFALTVQSSAALECHSRGIPVFLCGWLREPNCGYLEQYARFGVGQVLQSPAEIAEIPRFLAARPAERSAQTIQTQRTNPVSLHDLLHGAETLSSSKAQSTGD
jgi:hypothetical protein